MRFDVELINIITADSAYENVHKRMFLSKTLRYQTTFCKKYFVLLLISIFVLSQRNKWFTIALYHCHLISTNFVQKRM